MLLAGSFRPMVMIFWTEDTKIKKRYETILLKTEIPEVVQTQQMR